MKKVFYIYILSLFLINCTNNLKYSNNNKYLEIDSVLFNKLYKNKLLLHPLSIISKKPKTYIPYISYIILDDNYSLFISNCVDTLFLNKKPIYIFKEINKKNITIYRSYYDLYEYNKLNISDSILYGTEEWTNFKLKYISIPKKDNAGKLQEYYQKYDSVLIGKHFWFEYKNDNMILSKTINYDKIYPICWNKAIKLAKKQGIKDKFPKLIPPEYYPEVNRNNNKDNVFWIVSDNNKTIKINAYTGKKL